MAPRGTSKETPRRASCRLRPGHPVRKLFVRSRTSTARGAEACVATKSLYHTASGDPGGGGRTCRSPEKGARIGPPPATLADFCGRHCSCCSQPAYGDSPPLESLTPPLSSHPPASPPAGRRGGRNGGGGCRRLAPGHRGHGGHSPAPDAPHSPAAAPRPGPRRPRCDPRRPRSSRPRHRGDAPPLPSLSTSGGSRKTPPMPPADPRGASAIRSVFPRPAVLRQAILVG
jgi:hypothetical protein